MIPIFVVLIFVLGLVVGSFLNVVILRYNTGLTLNGRSACADCAISLRWFELIPLASFAIQRGRCRECKSKISLQYPIVELLTAVLFVLSTWFVVDFSSSVQSVILSSTFLIITMSIFVVIIAHDLRHKIIPDPFVFAFIILSGLTVFFDVGTLSMKSFDIWHLLAGPIMFLPFALLYYLSGVEWKKFSFNSNNVGKWMGFGDAKLAWGIGWFLGLAPAISGIILGFWIGAVYAILAIFIKKLTKNSSNIVLYSYLRGFKMDSEIPFAPFLILGTLLALFFGVDVLFLEGIF